MSETGISSVSSNQSPTGPPIFRSMTWSSIVAEGISELSSNKLRCSKSPPQKIKREAMKSANDLLDLSSCYSLLVVNFTSLKDARASAPDRRYHHGILLTGSY